jgi:hypothetical protein
MAIVSDGEIERILPRHTKGFDAKNKISSKVLIPQENISFDLPFEAGEDLLAGYAASIDSDGKLYYASSLQSVGRPANGFVVKGALIGETAYLRDTLTIATTLTLTLGNDSPIYLRSGTPNYSQTPLSASTGSEDIFQIIGVPNNANSILITIREPENYK